MKKTIIAFFKNEKNVQKTLNSLVQAGLDTSNISMIMKDKNSSDSNESRQEPYDENDAFNKAAGTILSISGEDLGTQAVSVPGFGEIVIAGALLSQMDGIGFEDNLDNIETRFDEALIALGIPSQEVDAFEQRIKSNQILAVMPVDEENRNEIAMHFSDHGAELMNYDMELN